MGKKWSFPSNDIDVIHGIGWRFCCLLRYPVRVKHLDWRNELSEVIDDWAVFSPKRHLVISPDIDGITSAAILNSIYPLKIIGIYTTTHLLLLDNHTKDEAKNALWLDHDISQKGIRSVGQHIVLHKPSDKLPLRDERSWNPNVWVKQSWADSFSGVGGKKRDKYPYGTAHFLWDLQNKNATPSPEQLAIMAHTDGTWFALDCYKVNGKIWKDLMFPNSAWVEKLLDYRNEHLAHPLHKDLTNELFGIGYSSQSRARKAQNLPAELKSLVGRQSLTIRLTSNPERYLGKIKEGIKLIGGYLDSTPDIGSKPQPLISGKRELMYPNRVENFDELMINEQIFSHAFTDLRSLSYTININL